MEEICYTTTGTCATRIRFRRERNTISGISFEGGCNGNLKAIAKLCEGMRAEDIAKVLAGNTCGARKTSCADQLAKAVLSGRE